MTRLIPVACDSGASIQGARIVVNFDLNTIGVRQPGIPVGRAPQSQRELESRHVGVFHPSVLRHGQYFDQAPWSILDTDWRQAKAVWGPKVH